MSSKVVSPKAQKLAREAKKSAIFRGHTLSKWEWKELPTRTVGTAYCEKCNRYVTVDTNPAPNSIDIGGSAIAVSCRN